MTSIQHYRLMSASKSPKHAPVARVVSMPRAAQAMPYMLASEKLTKMAMAIIRQGMMQDLYPRASPKMMSVAGPVLQASATSYI